MLYVKETRRVLQWQEENGRAVKMEVRDYGAHQGAIVHRVSSIRQALRMLGLA